LVEQRADLHLLDALVPSLEGLSDHINEQLAELARDLRVSIMTRDPRWCSFRGMAQNSEPPGVVPAELRELEIALEVRIPPAGQCRCTIDDELDRGCAACS
jgi:hypothetical protein